MLQPDLREQLVQAKILNLGELLDFLGDVMARIRAEYADDKKLSVFEALKIVWQIRSEASAAFGDVSQLDDELAHLDGEKFDLLARVVVVHLTGFVPDYVMAVTFRWLALVRDGVNLWAHYKGEALPPPKATIIQ